VKGVIFDMDGVLVDSSQAHLASWQALGREIGRDFPPSLFQATFGMHNHQIIPLWLGETPPDLERLAQRKEELYRAAAPATVRALPGAVELVRELAGEGFALAVASSGPRANVELILDLLGLRPLFAALATGEDVRRGKPDPEVFRVALERLGLPPQACVVIEDAPQGVEGALAAGTAVVAVCSTRPARDFQAYPVTVVQSLGELSADRLRRLLDPPDASAG
jgi:beta-phosphoglucomutase